MGMDNSYGKDLSLRGTSKPALEDGERQQTSDLHPCLVPYNGESPQQLSSPGKPQPAPAGVYDVNSSVSSVQFGGLSMDQPVPKYGYLALSCSSRRQTMYQTVPSQGEWMNANVTEGVGGRKRRACSGGLEHFAAQLVQGAGLVEGVLRRESLACCTALHVSQEAVTLDEGCGWQYSVPYQGTRGVKFASSGIW